MASRGRGKGLGLRIGVPVRGVAGKPQPLPIPQPLPVPQPLPLPPGPSAPASSTSSSSSSTSSSSTGPSSNRPPVGPSGSSGAASSAVPRATLPLRQPVTVFTPREDVALEDLERLQPPLGFGSGGRVYKVKHRKTGREYALKIIQERYEEMVRKQIVQEMQILRRTQSDYVVQCYGIFDHMGEISFVLELMDKGTLADVMKKRGRIAEQHLAEVARQVLQGLLYLHKQHVVHRDIKPSNLLINHQGQVKIADFGVSKELANTMAHCNSYVGTSAYLSPERINPPQGAAGYDGYSSDIWSFGLALLELNMGRFPYVQAGQSADWMTLFGAIVFNDPPQAPSDTSPEFRSFVASCLQKEPKQRLTAAALLEHPFCRMYTEPQWADLKQLLS